MKSVQKPIRKFVSTAVIAIMTQNAANAGSFSLYTESSPAAIGNYAAGIAAEAADASTGWYNPAGLSLIHSRQAVFGLVAIYPTAELTGTSTFSTLGVPSYTQTFNGLNGSKSGYVPSFHVAAPIGANSGVGFSVVAPFGLSTQWDQFGPLRYAATTSALVTMNASPEIGGKLTENFAIGAGIDFQYARVRFNSVLGAPALLQSFSAPPFTLDSLSYNRGQSFGLGFHAGVMGMFNDEHTRIGLNYQSQVQHRFNGYSRLQGRLAGLSPVLSPAAILTANPAARIWSNDLASNTITLPDVTTLSAYQDINTKIALLGSVVYTGWNSLKTLELKRVAAYAPGQGQVVVNSVTSENYRNTWRFALGANYHHNDQWMLRVGGGYDQTPTQDVYRDIRVPDANRWALSIGTHYQARPNIGLDLGYTHLFSAGDSYINKSSVAGTGSTYNVRAKVNGNANLIGVQAVWTLDQPMVVSNK